MLLIRVLHRGYKLFISPLLAWMAGPGGGCRFEPSCSDYMLEAVETHGLARGGWLGVKRLGRCQPWGGQGFDLVPPLFQKSPPGSEEIIMEYSACDCPHHTPRESAQPFRTSNLELRASL